nr:hypothetical protein [uncultured Lichenicoccus sp.]
MSLFRTTDDERPTFDPPRDTHWQNARIASLEQEIEELRYLLAERDVEIAGLRWAPAPGGRVVRLSTQPRPVLQLVVNHDQ